MREHPGVESYLTQVRGRCTGAKMLVRGSENLTVPDPRLNRKHPPLPPHHSATFSPTSDFFVSEQGETVNLGQVNLHS